MGGHALKKITTVRLPRDRYNLVKNNVSEKLKENNIEHGFIPDLPTKEDFGDLDVLLNHDSEIVETIKRIFAPDEIVRNGHVISFNIENFQIDFIQTTSIAFGRFYFSYSVFGNILGHLCHSYRVTFGHDGFYVSEAKDDSSQLMGKFFLSADPEEVAKYLGLDYEKWKNVKTIEDVYELIITTRLFDKRAFENESHRDRRRENARPEYKAFFKYIGVEPTIKEQVVVSDKSHDALLFFGKDKEYELLKKMRTMQIRLNAERQRKFNGNLFIPHGFEGRRLGKVKEEFKLLHGDFEQWLDEHSAEEVAEEIRKFCSERKNF